jgi:hypothetical protein
MNKEKLYVCVFRTGGTENFAWHRTLSMTYRQALLAKMEVEQGGRPCYVVEHERSKAIGLPETYEA